MQYNFSGFTTVEQCDEAIVKFEGRRSRAIFDKANREAAVASRASTSPLIPSRIESLDAQIETATTALAEAQGTQAQAEAEIALNTLKLERARLVMRSLQSEPEDIAEDQLAIHDLELEVVKYDAALVALNARKAEILAAA